MLARRHDNSTCFSVHIVVSDIVNFILIVTASFFTSFILALLLCVVAPIRTLSLRFSYVLAVSARGLATATDDTRTSDLVSALYRHKYPLYSGLSAVLLPYSLFFPITPTGSPSRAVWTYLWYHHVSGGNNLAT